MQILPVSYGVSCSFLPQFYDPSIRNNDFCICPVHMIFLEVLMTLQMQNDFINYTALHRHSGFNPTNIY